MSGVGKFTSDQDAEISAFTIVLQAIYNWPFVIRSPAQLCLATKLADYYCTLPSLSRSLYGAFGRSPDFCNSIRGNIIDLLEVAVKLRNEILYRECMTLLMGPWIHPKYLMIKDKKLKQLAASAHHSICSKILMIQTFVMEETLGEDREVLKDFREQELDAITQNLDRNSDEVSSLCLPLLYRQLTNTHFGHHFAWLLRNHLTLYPAVRVEWGPFRTIAKPGDRDTWCEDYFLCLEIKDDELPWDSNEKDW